MAYPLLVILVAIIVVFALVLYVVPVFSSMYENFDAELPALTQLVVQISNSLRGNWCTMYQDLLYCSPDSWVLAQLANSSICAMSC